MIPKVPENTSKQSNLALTAEGGEINIETDIKKTKIDEVYKSLVGVSGKDLVRTLLNQACNCCKGKNYDDKLNVIMPLLLDIAPRDSLEGLLAVQMIATHNMAMEMAGRAMLDGQTVEGVEMNINRSTKLMRTFTAQLETLQKYRNKGQQTIKVQHVTVNDGGQAVVGNVAGGEG